MPISPLLMSALSQQHPLFFGVEAQADGDAVEDQRLLAVVPCKHDSAATEA